MKLKEALNICFFDDLKKYLKQLLIVMFFIVVGYFITKKVITGIIVGVGLTYLAGAILLCMTTFSRAKDVENTRH